MQMTSHVPINALKLLESKHWVSIVCNSSNIEAVREILVQCAQIMLRYWEARFDRDESMVKLTNAIRQYSSNPNRELRAKLKSLVPPNRVPRRWELSPPPGLFPDNLSCDCPADFAGDAITYTALALVECGTSIHPSHVCSAIENSIETIARVFGERNLDDDNDVDHHAAANDYVRLKLLCRLQIQNARSNHNLESDA